MLHYSPLCFFSCSSSSGKDRISAMWHQQPAQVHRPAHQSDSPQNQQNQQGKCKRYSMYYKFVSNLVLQYNITFLALWRGCKWLWVTVSFPGDYKAVWKYLGVCFHTLNIFLLAHLTTSAQFQRKKRVSLGGNTMMEIL